MSKPVSPTRGLSPHHYVSIKKILIHIQTKAINIYIYIQIHTHLNMHTQKDTYMHTYIDTQIHTYIHTYTNTQAHTYICIHLCRLSYIYTLCINELTKNTAITHPLASPPIRPPTHPPTHPATHPTTHPWPMATVFTTPISRRDSDCE